MRVPKHVCSFYYFLLLPFTPEMHVLSYVCFVLILLLRVARIKVRFVFFLFYLYFLPCMKVSVFRSFFFVIKIPYPWYRYEYAK